MQQGSHRRVGIHKAISGCEDHILVWTEIDSRAEQELLPLGDDFVPPPLPLKMDSPSLANGVVSKVVVPAIGVDCRYALRILRKGRMSNQDKDEA